MIERLGIVLEEDKFTNGGEFPPENTIEAEEETIETEQNAAEGQIPADKGSNNNKFITTMLVTALIVGAACFGIGRITAVPADHIVAKVENESITKDELYNNLKGRYGSEALDQLIGDKIIELESKKENITVSEEETQKELESVIVQFGGKEQFDALMESYGYSMEEFTEGIVKNLTLKKLLEPRITITEADMKEYFVQNKGSFEVQEQVKASHILVDSEPKAREVMGKLNAGGDFAALAKEYSIDIGTSEKGGELGFFPRDTMVKEFEDVAFSLQPGAISEPVQTKYGYHIIRAEDKIEKKAAVYEENAEKIKDILISQKMPEVYNNWMNEKYSEYKIEKLL
ncbi:MAG TPA: peptidylprolyl isomerase [Bacillota bacterium]|nr:peptidylprolyl isomerase [Bacillota bacterium]